MTLYAYGLESLILFTTPAAAQGWRALRWRPAALLAVATVAAGIGMNGGFWPLFHAPLAATPGRLARRELLAQLPHGFIGRLFGVGAGQWGDWLLYQGTLVAVIAVALIAMLADSPVSRRVLALLAVPFALGAVIYLCSLISPPPPAAVGNALAVSPLLLILLAAMALALGQGRRPGPGVPSGPAPPGDA